MCSIPQETAAPFALGGTACERADRALGTLQAYQAAHVTMASSAEMVADMTGEGLLTADEAMVSLRRHVERYRVELAALDGKGAHHAA